MDLLVIGDLHLRQSGDVVNLNEVESKYDAVVCVGDIVDHQEHSPEIGSAFLRQFDESDMSVFTVPGNHDYKIYDHLVAASGNVTDLHKTAHDFNDICFFGLGSERFADGPEFKYTEYTHTFEGKEDDIESIVDKLIRNGELRTSLDEHFSIERTSEMQKQIEAYTDNYRTLSRLSNSCDSELQILVTHVPPFFTGFDTLPNTVPHRGGLHWGSLSVKRFLVDDAVTAVLCGHFHEHPGVEDIHGTNCLNAGYRNTYSVSISEQKLSIREVSGVLEF